MNNQGRTTRTVQRFTLMEIVVTIVVSAIVGAILVPITGSVLLRSHIPLVNLRRSSALGAEMAAVMAAYHSDIPEDPTAMAAFQTSIPGLIDTGVAEVLTNDLVMFTESAGVFVEQTCDPADSLDCVLKVRLGSVLTSGESLTVFLPYRRDEVVVDEEAE
jgi:hypothetical protein